MDEGIFQQPSPEQLAAFVAGDPVAEDEVLRLILPQLYRWARHHYSNLPEADVESEINRVVYETCRPRVRYKLNAGTTLSTYLIGLIKLRLNDLYQRQKRIKQSEVSESDESEKWLRLPYNQVEDEETRITRETFFQEVGQHLEGPEKDFLQLMRQGEKKLDVFAKILESYGPVAEPEKEVKNMKERLLRKLRAFAEQHGYSIKDMLAN
jgi:hypothetical protein